jgi:hypothetical protein
MVNTNHPSLMTDPTAIRVPFTEVEPDAVAVAALALRAMEDRLAMHGVQILDSEATQIQNHLAGRLRGMKLALSRREAALGDDSYLVRRFGAAG